MGTSKVVVLSFDRNLRLKAQAEKLMLLMKRIWEA